MRAAALLIALAMLLPGSFVAPQIGMLAWCWMSFASPQQYAYFTTLPLVYIVALVTAIGWVCSPEPKRIPFNATTIFIIAFMACMTLSTMLSLDPSLSWKAWDRNIKNVLIALAIMALMRSRVRIYALVWVIVLSLGMYSIKGGLFTIVTGSVNHVVGLSGTMIADNNQIGLAMTIAWPLMYYLRQHSVNRWVRHGLVVMMVLTIAAVLGTYSRGAFLAFSIVLIYFFWKSRHKLTIAVCGAALLVPIVLYVPRGWVDRMQSIETYQEDSSALGRFASWQLAISIAKARPLIGGGLELILSPRVIERFSPGKPALEAHSVWFETLADTGYPGLVLFALIWLTGWYQCISIRRALRYRPDLLWARDLATMGQLSLAGFAVAGSFLSMAYYDVYYAIIAIVSVVHYDFAVRSRAPVAAREGLIPALPRDGVPAAERSG